MDCHICAMIRSTGEINLCPCCDYPGCLHAEELTELLDWWLFSETAKPFAEWLISKVEARASA